MDRPAECVDGLVGVPDHAQFRRRWVAVGRPDELANQRVLGTVGVLVLVDQDVPEPAAVLLRHVREDPQENPPSS